MVDYWEAGMLKHYQAAEKRSSVPACVGIALIPDRESGSLRHTEKYASFLRISGALHLRIFDQPGENSCFKSMIGTMKKNVPAKSSPSKGVMTLSRWLVILLAICCHQLLYAASAEKTVLRSPDILKGEELTFDISFWLFKNAARSRMTFIKTGDTYVATLEAQTSGFIGFVTRHIKERMTSIMRFDARRGCLQPLSFQEEFTQGDRPRKRTVTFNHEKRILAVTYESATGKKKTITRKFFKHDCDDLLTAFYNVRLGYYGDPQKGSRFQVVIYTKEKASNLQIAFPEADKTVPQSPCRGTRYVVVTMDKDLTNMATRQLTGWLSNDRVPLCGTVEDAYLLGDLKVMLRERKIAGE